MPGAVKRSQAHRDHQQTQFTKRHLFHCSSALWLITSWPVCEMTATYSPVNRKICTCSILGVGEQRRGGWSWGKGSSQREREKAGGDHCLTREQGQVQVEGQGKHQRIGSEYGGRALWPGCCYFSFLFKDNLAKCWWPKVLHHHHLRAGAWGQTCSFAVVSRGL